MAQLLLKEMENSYLIVHVGLCQAVVLGAHKQPG